MGHSQSRFVWKAILAIVSIIRIADAQVPQAVAEREVGVAIVKTADGPVRGTVADDVIAFKGIPFAQPPVGELRWRPPQPVKPWIVTRDATKYSADPLQPATGGSLPANVAANPAGNTEDCLYLNVWRPVNSDGKPLPVMVWIYGGGLVRGGASIYPGDFLAKQGVVVVTFNYRVGRLGFFAHPALAKETPAALRGNYGYMDQLAALKWVQRNIAAFGGDPNQVTIAGESPGGGSVLVMLTSPMARGMFHRAILQSPAMPSPRLDVSPMRKLVDAEAMAVDYTNTLGITGDDVATLVALRALPAEKLIEGTEQYAAAIFGGPQISGLSFSIIDGQLVTTSPEAALREMKQARVPVLVGANDYDLALGPEQTRDVLFQRYGRHATRARQLYDPTGTASFDSVRQAVLCDRTMIEPSRHLAEEVARAGQPAYFYRFSYVAESERGRTPGAKHGTEITYAFAAAAPVLREAATKSDLEMSRTLSGYWTAFIKTGNPNGDGRPEWPRYDVAKEDVVNFTNEGVKVGPDPLKARLDLWRDVWR